MDPITIAIIGLAGGWGLAWLASQIGGASTVGSVNTSPWIPPPPPTSATQGAIIAIDPRIVSSHAMGVGIPCVSNPPPPVGWAYWQGQSSVTPGLAALCTYILPDPAQYPMGSFVQQVIDGNLVAVRVEWHAIIGATGATGCFRGTNLLSPTVDNPYDA